MHGQHQTERSSNTHQNDHNVHGDADKPRVVDVVVLDVATLVGQEEAEHNQQTLVHIQRPDQVREVVTLTQLVDVVHIIIAVLYGKGWVLREKQFNAEGKQIVLLLNPIQFYKLIEEKRESPHLLWKGN